MKRISLFLISFCLIILTCCSNSNKKRIGIGRKDQFIKCPETPNCVSSSVDKDHKMYIEPMTYKGDKVEAKEKLKDVLLSYKTLMLVEESNNYIHVESKSLIFHFIDDLEFYFPKDKELIYLKSGSRVGYTDFGVNRRRLERIREDFND